MTLDDVGRWRSNMLDDVGLRWTLHGVHALSVRADGRGKPGPSAHMQDGTPNSPICAILAVK
jgi:hypothetical protein